MKPAFPDLPLELPQLLDTDFFNSWAASDMWKGKIYRYGAVYKPFDPQQAMYEYFKAPLSIWGGIGDVNYRLAAKHFKAKQIEAAYSHFINDKLGVPQAWNMTTTIRLPQTGE